MSENKLKVAVGISGGVDSALAAALLVEKGYDVTGVFMECWNEPGCRTDDDRKDALSVALKLKIPFKVLDFKKEYRKKVVDWFYAEYKKGYTPNPDIICNKEIKFGIFYDWMVGQNFDFMATGHYARMKEGKLLRSVDENKDQTYFLAMVGASQLARTLFPIGHLNKSQVRKEAQKRGFKVWDKKDSTGICFIGNDYSFNEFLKRKIKVHEGEVVNKKGEVVGSHQGVEFYTIGQRHGFKVNPQSTQSQALYVVAKNAKDNHLVVGGKKDLQRKEFKVEKWQWISKNMQVPYLHVLVRIRHRGELVRAKIEGKKVKLAKPVLGVAPGQVAVIYSGFECLGGGVIVS
jgi:tRNA-specific 2-thiouridylase